MVRRSSISNRVRLSVTQLEDRCVPAGLIDVTYQPGFVVIQGDNHDNHVRVEHVQVTPNIYDVQVSSASGPMRFANAISGESFITDDPIVFRHVGGSELFIETGNGADTIEVISTARPNPNYQMDWINLFISSGNGDDQVFLDDVQAPLYISTGNGADLVTLRNCFGHISHPDYSYADIDTGSGDDRVVMLGTNSYRSIYISLGAGDDVLEGDSSAILPFETWFGAEPGDGYDRLLNADYFRATERPFVSAFFEEVNY